MRAIAPALAILALSAPAVADEPEAKAKQAAVTFLKAVKSKDVEAVMKLVDVPFVYREEGGGRAVKAHRDRDALRKWLSARLEDVRDAEKVPTEVDEVLTAAAVKERIKDADERALADEVLGGDGYLAVVTTGDDKKAGVAVRFRDGKAAVVGVIVK